MFDTIRSALQSVIGVFDFIFSVLNIIVQGINGIISIISSLFTLIKSIFMILPSQLYYCFSAFLITYIVIFTFKIVRKG